MFTIHVFLAIFSFILFAFFHNFRSFHCTFLSFVEMDQAFSLMEGGNDSLKSLIETIALLLSHDLESIRPLDQTSMNIDPLQPSHLLDCPAHLFTKFFRHFRQPSILSNIEKFISALVFTSE